MAYRAIIACVRCKTRKRRCDGKKPRCANCIAHNAECNYATVRRTRGPGKRNGDEQVTAKPEHGEPYISHAAEPTIAHEPNSNKLSQAGNWPKSFEIFPEFLSPGSFDYHLNEIERSRGAIASTQKFTPLLPIHISQRMINGCFAEIMAKYELLSLESFLQLLDAQYATSSNGPGDNPARWATVNAIIATALRFKTAPGSESDLSHIASMFYQNATAVMDKLILGSPSLASMQALSAMAIYARGAPDNHGFIMLATNVSCQRKLFRKGLLQEDSMVHVEEAQSYKHVCQAIDKFDTEVEWDGTGRNA